MQKKKLVIRCASFFIPLFAAAFTIWCLTESRTGLRAELIVNNADIGIPGISKMYEARLVILASWPIRVSYCDFVDDTLTRGKMVGYAVERWDNVARSWTTVVDAHGVDFCKPYPLGIVKANLTSGLLWPGQSISTGEEATAARDGLNIGDRARFVVFPGMAQESVSVIATSDFVIDQHRQTDVPLRVRH